uniref:site-specific DNA-methyltransferase (cytosine-N(4)-specific) n=1 Tax=viral metagenome TaxID=1070528 RepID=A0A6M3LD61_9ZZZZ
MEPYYETELGKLYHGRFPDILAGLEIKADLVITSPPYDDLRKYGGKEFQFIPVADGLEHITKPGGIIVWVVGDSTINGSESLSAFKQAIYFVEKCRFNLHDTMIYQKNGPAYPSQNRYYQIFEYMFILSNGRPKTFNPIKDRKNKWFGQKWSNKRSRRNKEGILKDSEWSQSEGLEYGTRFNIWKYNVGHGYSTKDLIAYEHPAIFPEQLAADHILSWSNEGDTVMDIMAGSGTVVKMAERLKRKWIAVEIEFKYCEIIKQRIKNERKQLKLWK